ncbi:MAG: hypothetical protein QM703_06425 [Gemmatales bacterium]
MSTRYQVSWSMVTSWISERYSELYEVDDEAVTEFKNEMMAIQDQLSAHPFEFGEPIDDLLKLDMTRCVGFTRRLIVNYGVNPASRFVIVTKLRWRKRSL